MQNTVPFKFKIIGEKQLSICLEEYYRQYLQGFETKKVHQDRMMDGNRIFIQEFCLITTAMLTLCV